MYCIADYIRITDLGIIGINFESYTGGLNLGTRGLDSTTVPLSKPVTRTIEVRIKEESKFINLEFKEAKIFKKKEIKLEITEKGNTTAYRLFRG